MTHEIKKVVELYEKNHARFRQLQEITATCECSCGGRLNVAIEKGEVVLHCSNCGRGCEAPKPVRVRTYRPWWITPKKKFNKGGEQE